MSGKLAQSLDTIMAESKSSGGNKRRGPRKAALKSKAATTAVIAPSGGVQKQKQTARGTKPARGAAAAPQTGESKISVSNLPEDVTEQLIKDYFTASVAPVKRVVIAYGPTGRSRGSATVSFSKPTAAADAVKLDGTRVDNKPMRIELLVSASNIAPIKSLQERVSGKPKNAAKEKPKEAAGAKGAAAGAKGGRATKKKSGRGGKPKSKTAEELDAEMQDYFGGDNTGAAANGTAQPAAATNGGDTGMTDEVL